MTGGGGSGVAGAALIVHSARARQQWSPTAFSGIARLPTFYVADLVTRGALVPVLQAFWDCATVYAVRPRMITADRRVTEVIALARELVPKFLAAG